MLQRTEFELRIPSTEIRPAMSPTKDQLTDAGSSARLDVI